MWCSYVSQGARSCTSANTSTRRERRMRSTRRFLISNLGDKQRFTWLQPLRQLHKHISHSDSVNVRFLSSKNCHHPFHHGLIHTDWVMLGFPRSVGHAGPSVTSFSKDSSHCLSALKHIFWKVYDCRFLGNGFGRSA